MAEQILRVVDGEFQPKNLGFHPTVPVSRGVRPRSKSAAQLTQQQYAEQQRKYNNLIGQPITSNTELQPRSHPVYIKFFIRSALDPLGVLSPRLESRENMELEKIFDCYLSETYEDHPFMPPRHSVQALEDYSLMTLNLATRTLGRRYSYAKAKKLGLRVRDTEWWDAKKMGSTNIMLVSSDRVPRGNYKQNEAVISEEILLTEDGTVQGHDSILGRL